LIFAVSVAASLAVGRTPLPSVLEFKLTFQCT
jgi:hypothetical protein